MLHTILVILYILVCMIASLPLFLIEMIMRKGNPERAQWFSQKYIQAVFRGILVCTGVKLTVKGLENIPKDQPVIYIANHKGFFDIPIIYSMAPGLTGIIAKKEIGKMPVFHRWMVLLKCSFLDRDDIRASLKTILNAIEFVKGGTSQLVFPEGHRGHEDTNTQEFKEGSFKLATKPKAPIVPVALLGTAQVFEDCGHLGVRPGHVVIEFAPAIATDGISREEEKELPARVQGVIVEMLRNNYPIWEGSKKK